MKLVITLSFLFFGFYSLAGETTPIQQPLSTVAELNTADGLELQGIDDFLSYRCVARFNGRVRNPRKPTTFEGWAKRRRVAERRALNRCYDYFPRRWRRCQLVKCHRRIDF